METRIKPVNAQSLAEAKNIIQSGGVVAIPTETVYGLGGNAFDDNAVKKIFEIKGRPNDNPLIAHVHQDYDVLKIVDYVTPVAEKLRKAFPCGPLTLVYPSTGKVSPYVSCGLNTLAVRIPSHEGAQQFLRAVDIPIVAPSANISRHVSPTTAMHVYDDFAGKLPLILDGGACVGGIESTVCDVTGDVPIILRPGLITREMIRDVVGACEVYTHNENSGEKVKSPGVLYKHYAPRCETVLLPSKTAKSQISAYVSQSLENKGIAVLCEEKRIYDFENLPVKCLNLGKNQTEMAMRLYDLLREAERVCEVLFVVEPDEKTGIMEGVLNRLYKACSSKDIKH